MSKKPPIKFPPPKDPVKSGKAKSKTRRSVRGEGTFHVYGTDIKKGESGLSHKGDPLVTMYAKATKTAVGGRVRHGAASKNALGLAKAQDIESLYEHSPFTKKDKY